MLYYLLSYPHQRCRPPIKAVSQVLCLERLQSQTSFLRFETKLSQMLFTVASVQFSHSVTQSDSSQLHESQHARPPCPTPTPRVYSNSCPSSWWCHPAISSSVVPFSSCPPSQHQGLFQWINSSHEVTNVLEIQFQHQSFQWTPRTDLLAVQGTFKSLLQHHSSKASIFWHSAFLTVQLSHPYMTTGKTIALTRQTFVWKVMSLLFNMLSRLVITLLYCYILLCNICYILLCNSVIAELHITFQLYQGFCLLEDCVKLLLCVHFL